MKKIYLLLRKYSPDFVLLVGIFILSYASLRPIDNKIRFQSLIHKYGGLEAWQWKVLGILLIALAIDVLVRRFLITKVPKQ